MSKEKIRLVSIIALLEKMKEYLKEDLKALKESEKKVEDLKKDIEELEKWIEENQPIKLSEESKIKKPKRKKI